MLFSPGLDRSRRLMATVTISAPDASMDETISSGLLCRPVPTISLEAKLLPAIVSGSSISSSSLQ